MSVFVISNYFFYKMNFPKNIVSTIFKFKIIFESIYTYVSILEIIQKPIVLKFLNDFKILFSFNNICCNILFKLFMTIIVSLKLTTYLTL